MASSISIRRVDYGGVGISRVWILLKQISIKSIDFRQCRFLAPLLFVLQYTEEIMARIVILGAGPAGTIAAFQLRHELEACHDVAVINKGRIFQLRSFQPLGCRWLADPQRRKDRSRTHLPLAFLRQAS
ncbi:hypothetical protein HGP16_28055 [Rhizobium sp. P40RR-XXII]|uniref:tryptophan 7-halogenase n=1 Tax=Rhizobium sp. P40RR-XXII TaxID=2726739 RepID=UPI001457436C|nr:tryptophan 7-halogenase [Rhizobium sp. P40RR-XXII]NLS20389.1 hypothetical protein [Rhizobium sp. P40RR-XXII]